MKKYTNNRYGHRASAAQSAETVNPTVAASSDGPKSAPSSRLTTYSKGAGAYKRYVVETQTNGRAAVSREDWEKGKR